MARLTRDEAQLVLAAIRVLGHLRERSPTPEEIADLLQFFINAGAYGKNLRVIGRKAHHRYDR